jgi:two-component system, LytTR family, response regulator
MLKVIIIEDEQKAAQMLQIMLQELEPGIQVMELCADLPAGVRAIKKHQPDLIFLDIEMPGYSGLQLLEFFNDDEVHFSIVFTTAFNDYAIKAFELSAIDYILKPIQVEKLQAAIDKFKKIQKGLPAKQIGLLKAHLQNGGIRKIAIPVSNGLEIIGLDEIRYFEAEGSYTRIWLQANRQLLVSKKLKHFEDLFEASTLFCRNHRSYMVNLNSVKKFLRSGGGLLLLDDGKELPVSAERADEVVQMLSNMHDY